jgi:hypothetical protein
MAPHDYNGCPMARRPFAIDYAIRVTAHLAAIERKHHSLIRETIRQQLSFDPDVQTRNRKRLLRPVTFEAEWELRFGPDNRFRVFYAVDVELSEVYVLAVGEKSGSRLFIAGEEFVL